MIRELEDVQSFTVFFSQYRQQYVLYAFSYVRDRNLAEDIFMESISSLWENRMKWSDQSDIRALLLTIIRNRSLNHLTREKKRIEVEKNMEHTQLRDIRLRISTLQASDPEKIFQIEIQHIIDRTLESLPEQTRKVFRYSRTENLSNKEIAQLMQLSVKSIEFHLTKALKVLKKNLGEYLTILWILLDISGNQ